MLRWLAIVGLLSGITVDAQAKQSLVQMPLDVSRVAGDRASIGHEIERGLASEVQRLLHGEDVRFLAFDFVRADLSNRGLDATWCSERVNCLRWLATNLQADLFLTGVAESTGLGLSVSFRIIDVGSGNVLATMQLEGKHYVDVNDHMRGSVLEFLHRAGVDAREPPPPSSPPPPSPAPSPPPRPVGTELVLYPVKAGQEDPLIRTRVGREERNRVLKKLFKRWLPSLKQCAAYGSGDPAEARRRGEMTLSIEGVADGSFTAPGLQQTMYFVRIEECFQAHSTNIGSVLLAVLEEDKVVGKAFIDFPVKVTHVLDFNRDGRTDLVIETGVFSAGYYETSLTISNIERASLKTVKDFEQVGLDSCGADGKENYDDWVYATDIPGVPMEFRTVRKAYQCKW